MLFEPTLPLGLGHRGNFVTLVAHPHVPQAALGFMDVDVVLVAME